MHRTITTVVSFTLAAAVGVGLCVGLATTARAADMPGTVIATTTPDDALVVAKSPTATALASLPRGIVVTNHGGKPVTLSSQGKATVTKPRPGNAPATFTGLDAGRSYTVSVGGKVIGAVVAVSEPTAASGLVVRATASPTSVEMSWQATPTPQTGPFTYDVTATADGKPVVRATVKDGLNTRLTGLDPHALYTFAVVARNSAGAATPVSATMTRTLAEITGRDVELSVTPVKAAAPAPMPEPAPAPAPTSAPASAPAGPPAPTTRTIWVCPDGFTESAGVCTSTLTYTYQEQTQTAPYTYHSQFVETSRSWRDFGTDWSGTVCPNGGTLHAGQCVGWDVQGYSTQVKDSPPAGWYDDGTSYVKVTRIKDPAPTGYTDDGTNWTKTAAKVAKEVPV